MAGRKKTSVINYKEKNDFCWFEQSLKPMSIPMLNKIANELVEWAKNDDKALSISAFHARMDIAPGTWDRWIKNSPVLEEAQEIARLHIGLRRESGAILGKYNAATIMPYMSMFKKEYKDHAEWRASLNKDQTNQLQNIKVVIERFPETNVVPPKAIEVKDEREEQ